MRGRKLYILYLVQIVSVLKEEYLPQEIKHCIFFLQKYFKSRITPLEMSKLVIEYNRVSLLMCSSYMYI